MILDEDLHLPAGPFPLNSFCATDPFVLVISFKLLNLEEMLKHLITVSCALSTTVIIYLQYHGCF